MCLYMGLFGHTRFACLYEPAFDHKNSIRKQSEVDSKQKARVETGFRVVKVHAHKIILG